MRAIGCSADGWPLTRSSGVCVGCALACTCPRPPTPTMARKCVFMFCVRCLCACVLQRPTASDGHPALVGEPLASLQADFVARPALVGNLVTQSCNVWMGASQQGGRPAASGQGGPIQLWGSCSRSGKA